MTELKPGWNWVKFGQVVRLNRETCKDPVSEGIERVVGLEHLEPGDLRVRSWADVADGTTFTNRVRPGQVLFGKRRAYQRKVAVADFDAICSGDIYVFESADPKVLLPELLPYICQTDAFFDHAVGTSAGSLSPRTNWSSLADYEFALPPLEEQRRIDEVLSTSNLVLGTLVEATLAAEAAYTAALMATFVRDDAPSAINPGAWARTGWPTATLQSITATDAPISYGIVQPGASVAGGVPTATSNNLNIGFTYSIHFTSPEIEAPYARSRIEPHDVLLTVKGFGTGNVGIVPAFFRGNITRDVARIRFERPADGVFFAHLWKCPAYERYWRAISVGTTRPELSIGKLRAMIAPWPSPAQRRELGMQLSDIASAAADLRERRAQTYQLHRALVAKLLGEDARSASSAEARGVA